MSANRRDEISTRMELPWTDIYCVFLDMCERLGTIYLFLFFLGLGWTCYFFNGGVSATLLWTYRGECLFVWQVNTKCNIWHVLFVVPLSRNYNGNFQSRRRGGVLPYISDRWVPPTVLNPELFQGSDKQKLTFNVLPKPEKWHLIQGKIKTKNFMVRHKPASNHFPNTVSLCPQTKLKSG